MATERKFKITPQKEKLIRQDIEKYWMGQLRLIDVAKHRNVTIHLIGNIQNRMIAEKMLI